MTPMSPLPVGTVFTALTFGAVWVAWAIVKLVILIYGGDRSKSFYDDDDDDEIKRTLDVPTTAESAVQLGALDGSEDDDTEEKEEAAKEEAAPIVAVDAKPVAKPAASGHGHGAMVLPVAATLPSIEAMLRDWAQLGVIFLYCWINEYMPLFPPSGKTSNLDHFWFVTLIFLGSAAMTFAPAKDNGLLNRIQTEEWKGWMQFMFLAYHYYHQSETYNAVRVFISCYVWMTGFGNFSFFYLKRDFSSVRMWQMLWRLNFTVFWLCLLMGNSYILYYICPLHTFYFLVVFTTMYIGSSLNHKLWPMRIKLMLLGAIIFIVWEFDAVYVTLFGLVLPTTPMIGAKHGALHEWHFRTALDHWDTYFGMLFALNFPSMVKWLNGLENRDVTSKRSEYGIKVAISLICIVATMVWATTIFPMKKFAYNHNHPYFFMVPLLSYIWLRNCSKWARGYNAEMLVKMGKVTLETYLLQHHAWLSSNAKTLVVLVPGWPQVNTLVVTTIYILLAQKLFRLTISLRARHIPNEPRACLRYGVVLWATLGAIFALALGITLVHRADFLHIAIFQIAVGLIATLAIFCVLSAASSSPLAALEGGCGALTRSLPLVLIASTIVFAGAVVLGWIIPNPHANDLTIITPSGLDGLKVLPAGADNFGDPKLGLWAVVLAGLIIIFGDNMIGLARLFTCICGGKYPTKAESYDALNASIMRKTEEKRLLSFAACSRAPTPEAPDAQV